VHPIGSYCTKVKYCCAGKEALLLLNAKLMLFSLHVATAPCGARPPYYRGFMITLRHTLQEWLARRKAVYLTTHTHDRKTSMPPVRFEPAIPASEQPQTNPLGSSATGNGQIDAYTIHTPMALRHSEHCMIIAIMQSKWLRHRPLQVTCSNRDTLKWISMLCLVVLVLRVVVGFGMALKGCHCRSSQLCIVLDLHSWL